MNELCIGQQHIHRQYRFNTTILPKANWHFFIIKVLVNCIKFCKIFVGSQTTP